MGRQRLFHQMPHLYQQRAKTRNRLDVTSRYGWIFAKDANNTGMSSDDILDLTENIPDMVPGRPVFHARSEARSVACEMKSVALMSC